MSAVVNASDARDEHALLRLLFHRLNNQLGIILAHAELLFYRLEKRFDLGFQRRDLRGRDLVVDVIVQTGITASASPAALSTTTPPSNS